MNRIITTILCVLTSLAAVKGAGAQQRAVRVVIPFDFSASNAQLPAGSYVIATENGFTSITKSGTREKAFVAAIPVADDLPNDSKVVFSTYGDRHYLRKVLCPEINLSLELLPSKAEIKARVQSANNRVQPGNNSGD